MSIVNPQTSEVAKTPEVSETLLFSETLACIDCGISYPEMTPRMFSFNNPYGACPDCTGLGTRMYFDAELVVPNPELSIREGAIAPWEKRLSGWYHLTLDALAKAYKFDIRTPFKKLPKKAQEIILQGSQGEKVEFWWEEDGGRRHTYRKEFEGVLNNLERRWRESDSEQVREELERYMNIMPCPTCKGARLKKEALFVRIAGRNICEVTALSITDALAFFMDLSLTPKEGEIARRILKEIRERLHFLINVGLDYLSLDRTAGTLSGGEGQRIRLATQIGSSLVGVLYILDEPSIGLHQRDNARLLQTLRHLRDIGNTVLVVEHDEETILEADHVIDMGPGAGIHGGEVVAQGTPAEIMVNPNSLTGRYLSGELSIPVPEKRRKPARSLRIVGATGNNLKGIEVDIPLGVMTCVTGVSGGEVNPDHRYPLQGPLPAPLPESGKGGGNKNDPGARSPRQGDQHRPVPHRPYPPQQPRHLHRGVRRHPRPLCPTPGVAAAGVQTGTLLVQRQGGALRGLLGGRHHQDRDAFPSGRLCPV